LAELSGSPVQTEHPEGVVWAGEVIGPKRKKLRQVRVVCGDGGEEVPQVWDEPYFCWITARGSFADFILAEYRKATEGIDDPATP